MASGGGSKKKESATDTKKDKEPSVVIAVDASEQAEFAVQFYFDNVHQVGTPVVLVHVIELPEMSQSRQAYLSPAALAELWREEQAKSKELEKKYTDIIQTRQIRGVKMRSEGGMKPGQVLISVAKDENARMIVLGTRGMGKVRRTILGSVSDYVVHHSNIPVCVCRRKKQKERHASSSSTASNTSSSSMET